MSNVNSFALAVQYYSLFAIQFFFTFVLSAKFNQKTGFNLMWSMQKACSRTLHLITHSSLYFLYVNEKGF